MRKEPVGKFVIDAGVEKPPSFSVVSLSNEDLLDELVAGRGASDYRLALDEEAARRAADDMDFALALARRLA